MAAIRALSYVSRPPSSGGLNEFPDRILLIVVGGMGDALMAGSLAQHLMRRHPHFKADVVAGPTATDAIARYVTGRLYALPSNSIGLRSFVRTVRVVRCHDYQAVVDFSHEWLMTAILARATGMPVRIGFAPLSDNPRASLMTHAVKLDESRSAWEMYIRLGQTVDPGLSDQLPILPLSYTSSEEHDVLNWLRGQGGNTKELRIIALHIGCGPSRTYRRWPIDRFVRLAELLDARFGRSIIVLTGNPDERPLINEFCSRYSGCAIDASGLNSVGQTACLLRHCQLLVSVDTGIMHLGAAMGTPTVGLFGPNTPRHWAPVGRRATYLYLTRVPCSPCLNNYRNITPIECTHTERGRCMLDIQPEDVLEAAGRVMVGWCPAISA